MIEVSSDAESDELLEADSKLEFDEVSWPEELRSDTELDELVRLVDVVVSSIGIEILVKKEFPSTECG